MHLFSEALGRLDLCINKALRVFTKGLVDRFWDNWSLKGIHECDRGQRGNRYGRNGKVKHVLVIRSYQLLFNSLQSSKDNCLLVKDKLNPFLKDSVYFYFSEVRG